MSDEVVRKLVVGVGFRIDDGKLDQVDDRTRKTTKSADALEGAFKKAAAALAAFGLASKAMESIKANLDFEKQLGKLQTLVPDNISQVQNYRQELLDMSQRTGKGLGELADATYEVGSAFGVTADTIAITEMAAKAATAAGAETKDAVNLMSAVTLAYGDSTAKANSKVSDLASLAANLGKTSLPEMAAGIGQVTGAAVQLGVSQEELFAIIGTAAGVTGPTSQMLTQLKATMTNLSAPTKDLQKLYKKLGITSIEAEIAQNGLVPTLEKIVKATDGSVKTTAKLFASDEARAFILPMVTKLSGRYGDTLKAMGKAEGSAAKAHDASTEGLARNAHAAELAEAKLKALQVAVGQGLTPAYVEFLGLMVDVADAMRDTNTEHETMGESLRATIEDMRSFVTVAVTITKILAAPFIALGKMLEEYMAALSAVMNMAENGISTDGIKQVGVHLGKGVVHSISAATLGTPEIINQVVGGKGSMFESLGFDAKGLKESLKRDTGRIANRELSKTKEHFSNWANNLSIGNLVVNTTGLPAQQAEQAANAIPESILTRMFSRAEGVLAPPKVAQ